MEKPRQPGTVPEFAVLGHPNEGKSSVVSTLTEDDSIKVSPLPGETSQSTCYTVKIEGKDIIRFVDTPGFQVPKQTLAWFKKYSGNPEHIIDEFIKANQDNEFFADDCELLKPVARGAGIIYVVDGARPVRDDDLNEMEILRLTGRPRMAVINAKTNEKDYTPDWKNEFRKHFNVIRVFNSNTANFTERIRMLESLRAIDQEWEENLISVIAAFQKDYRKRNLLACMAICQSIEQILSFSLSEPIEKHSDRDAQMDAMNQTYQAKIRGFEKQLFQTLRSLFKHRIFDFHLPDHSILSHDLFSRQTWELLGLTRQQLVTAGAVVGGTAGVLVDAAFAGHSLGLFAAIGGALGAGSALIGGEKTAKNTFRGIRLGGDKLWFGPAKNPQLFYILLDRALLYYSHMIHRPHGKRDDSPGSEKNSGTKKGYCSEFTVNQKAICLKYFKTITGRSWARDKKSMTAFEEMLKDILSRLSGDQADEDFIF